VKQFWEFFIASNIMKFGFLGKSNMLIMNLKSEFGGRPSFLSQASLKQCQELLIASNIMKFGFLGKSNLLIMNLESEFGG
jgi:hypothetical protein